MILGKARDKRGNPVLLRTPSMKDLHRLVGYMNSLVEENANILLGKKISVKDEKSWLTDIIKRMKQGTYFYIIADVDGEIAGTANFAKGVHRQSHVAGFGVSVNKKFRKLGIGSLLAKEVFKHARRSGVRIITLGVFPRNTVAIKMYRKLGFKKYGLLPHSIRDGRGYTDEILMCRRLC
ncbi:MAG: GNAT family N-acetyltransferase [Candidatus Aenigmarchaeota archaeon]|nr:GNAT family N-acetyltransferase [Candidatus Aenigmarchaeota archaeon]